MRFRPLIPDEFPRTGPHRLNVSEIGFGAWAVGGSWGPQSEKGSTAALNRRSISASTSWPRRRIRRRQEPADHGGRPEGQRGDVTLRRDAAGRRTLAAVTLLPLGGALRRKVPRANLEERLRNLGADQIDLLQLHTWTRAWNRRPEPFEVLRKLKEEGFSPLSKTSSPTPLSNPLLNCPV